MSDCAGSEMSTEASLANGPAADLDPQTQLELEAAALSRACDASSGPQGMFKPSI